MEFRGHRAVIERDQPALEIGSLRPILDGWDSYVFDVNDAHIYRFPRRREVINNLRKEARLLPLLARHLRERTPARVPEFEIINLDEADLESSFVRYRKIPGARWQDRQNADRIAAELGVFLAAVHAFEVPPELGAWIPPQTALTWRGGYRRFYHRLAERVFPHLEAGLRSGCDRIFAGFLEDEANFVFSTRLIHADLAMEHILCDRSGRLRGVIDWEDACVGDPALDFVGFFIWGGDDFVERVLDQYSLDRGLNFWSRLRFYTLATSFHEMEFGLEIGDGRLFAEGKDRLRGYVRNYD